MQRKNQQTPKAGWRKSTRQAVPVSGSTPEFGVQGRGRRKLTIQVSFLAAMALALVVLLIVAYLRRPPYEVPLIVATVTESSRDFFVPPNPFALEDVELWEEWFKDDKKRRNDQNVAFFGLSKDRVGAMASLDNESGGQLGQLMMQGIDKARPGGPDGNMIALSITAQGVLDGEGEPYLLVGNSRADDKTTWVPVKVLLDKISAALEEKDCRAVLFLDANRAGAVWDWGKLDNSFVKACETQAKKFDKHLAIILSCGDQERSWWDPSRGYSLFARALLEAFAGHQDVDGEGSETRDGQISVGEIEAFLQKQVSRDASKLWDASQHPTLLSKTECKDWRFIGTPNWPTEFSESFANRVDEKSRQRVGTLRQRFDDIQDLWVAHNQLRDRDHSPLTTDPLQWSILEKRLARLDQLAIAGAGDSNYDSVRRECKDLIAKFKKGSVAVKNAGEFPELRLAQYFDSSQTLKNSEFEKTFYDEWAPKADVKVDLFELKTDPGGERKLMPSLWNWLRDDTTYPQASVETAYELLRRNEIGTTSSAPVKFLETHLIRLVTAPDLKGHVGESEADRILVLHDRSRDAAFPPDIRASFWIRHDAQRLNEERMQLTDRILGKRGSSEREVVNQLNSVDRRITKLESKGIEVSRAYQLRDRLLHEIPRIGETLLADPFAFPDQNRNITSLLRQATDATQNLQRQLRLKDVADEIDESDIGTSKIAARIQSIGTATENAGDQLDGLWKILNERATEAGGDDAGDGEALHKAVAMLHGSGLNQEETRGKLHTRLSDLIGGLKSRKIESSYISQDDGQREGENMQGSQDSPTTGNGTETQSDSIHPWVYWLSQIQYSDDDLDRADLASLSKLTLMEQGKWIRSALYELQNEDFDDVRRRPEELSTERERSNGFARVRHDVAELDAQLRSQLFLLDRTDTQIDDATRDRFRLDVQLFLMDHAARTMREFWCEAHEGKKEQPYFAAATESLLDRDAFPALKNSRILDGVPLRDQLAALQQAWDSPDTLLAHCNLERKNFRDIKELDEVQFAFRVPTSFPDGWVAAYGDAKKRKLVGTEPNASDNPDQEALVNIPVPRSFTKQNTQFKVSTFFRGLRREGSLTAQIRGIPDTVVFELPKYGRPKAIVEAEKEYSNIMLVFDCSISMENNGRMVAARKEIIKFVKGLPRRSKVGLILFGHRYMWHTVGGRPVQGPNSNCEYFVNFQGGNAGQRLVSPDDEKQGTTNPNFDVLEVATAQELDRQHRVRLIDAIQLDANPFGVTPTYQAISMAYDSARASQSHIIVLTDGEPYLFPGTYEFCPLVHGNVKNIGDRFRRDAQNKFRAAGPESLSIINFANDSNQTAMKAVFENPQDRQIVFDANRKTLERRLQEMIPKDSVRWRTETDMVGGPVKFDESVDIRPWPPSDRGVAVNKLVEPSEEYDVLAQLGNVQKSAPVHVQGGEAFQLKWNDSDDVLRHVPYINDAKQRSVYRKLDPITDSEYNFYVGRVRPERDGFLDVRVVIENRSPEKFTPRPSEIWIDFIAHDDEGDRRFSITLPEFVTDEPVPILQCRINNWPNVTEATIHVWAQFEGTKSRRKELSISSGEPLTIAGTTFEVETKTADSGEYVVEVEEAYRNAKELNSFRVLPQPLPDNGLIEFYRSAKTDTATAPQSNSVTRRFTYQEKPDDLKLWVTHEDEFKRAAIHASLERFRVHSE